MPNDVHPHGGDSLALQMESLSVLPKPSNSEWLKHFFTLIFIELILLSEVIVTVLIVHHTVNELDLSGNLAICQQHRIGDATTLSKFSSLNLSAGLAGVETKDQIDSHFSRIASWISLLTRFKWEKLQDYKLKSSLYQIQVGQPHRLSEDCFSIDLYISSLTSYIIPKTILMGLPILLSKAKSVRLKARQLGKEQERLNHTEDRENAHNNHILEMEDKMVEVNKEVAQQSKLKVEVEKWKAPLIQGNLMVGTVDDNK